MQIRTFYGIGAGLMIFSIIGSVWSNYILWSTFNIGGKISAVTSVLFNVLWFSLFIFLYKQTPKQPDQIINSPEIDKLLDNLKNDKGGQDGKK